MREGSHVSDTINPALLTIRNAVENASTSPVTDATILAILRGGPGSGSQLRAIFSDVSLAVLSRAALSTGYRLRPSFAPTPPHERPPSPPTPNWIKHLKVAGDGPPRRVVVGGRWQRLIHPRPTLGARHGRPVFPLPARATPPKPVVPMQ